MTKSTHFLLSLYAGAILLQGYVAYTYLSAALDRDAGPAKTSVSSNEAGPMLGHQTLTFDVLEPASGQ